MSRFYSIIVLIALWPVHYDCATPNNSDRFMDGRIVGGIETSILYFPHQASVQFESTHICGAAVLNARLVLTAAHCVTEYNQPLLYSVRAGSTQHARGGVVRQVGRIIPHELYNVPQSLNNDIALLVLDQLLAFNRYIQPIPMAAVEDVAGSVLFVSGWGAVSSELQQIASQLRYTVVQEMDHTKCSAAYKGAGTVTATMMCAGTEKGGRDSCQGDSGGPLVTYKGGFMKLYGIVSWGIGCAHPDYPGVYTRVAAYGQWVNQTMNRI